MYIHPFMLSRWRKQVRDVKCGSDQENALNSKWFSGISKPQ